MNPLVSLPSQTVGPRGVSQAQPRHTEVPGLTGLVNTCLSWEQNRQIDNLEKGRGGGKHQNKVSTAQEAQEPAEALPTMAYDPVFLWPKICSMDYKYIT